MNGQSGEAADSPPRTRETNPTSKAGKPTAQDTGSGPTDDQSGRATGPFSRTRARQNTQKAEESTAPVVDSGPTDDQSAEAAGPSSRRRGKQTTSKAGKPTTRDTGNRATDGQTIETAGPSARVSGGQDASKAEQTIECPTNKYNDKIACPKRFPRPRNLEDVKALRTHVTSCHPLSTMETGELSCLCLDKVGRNGRLRRTKFCLEDGCVSIVLPRNLRKNEPYSDTSWYTGKSTIPSTIEVNQKPPWIQHVINFISFFRQSSGDIPLALADQESVDYVAKRHYIDLGHLLDVQMDGPALHVTHCRTLYWPPLANESTPVHLRKSDTSPQSFGATWLYAQRAIQRLNDLIQESPGPTCIVILGLNWSGTDADRVLRWSNEQDRDMSFIHLVHADQRLPNDGEGLVHVLVEQCSGVIVMAVGVESSLVP